MKKFTTFIALLVICCTVGCTVGTEQSSATSTTSSTIPPKTLLTIENKSTVDITLLNWGSYSFNDKLLMIGSEYSIEITSGSNYIYFTKKDSVSNTDILYFTEYYTCRDNETSTFTFMDYTPVTQKDDTANKGILKDIQPRYSQLTIQNNSSYDLLNVTWIDTVFSSNPLEDILEADTFAVKYVSDGYGYVYFTIKNSDFMAKTKAVVSVPKHESVVFEITDETIVREQYNEDNIGTVETAEKKVVFYDDAEGEYKAYKQRTRCFYSEFDVYQGKKSIMMDSSVSALYFDIILTKTALLSFWYRTVYDKELVLYIDGSEVKEFKGADWSYFEYELTEGTHSIELDKIDNYNTNLDNIKIAYME